MAQSTAKELKQKKLIDSLRKEEKWMKWAILGALIVVLLLLLFIGYATDWMTGLKGSSSTPLSSTLDSSSQKAGTGTTNPVAGSTNTGTTSNQGSTSGSNQRTATGTNTATDTTRSNTSTTNSSTTNNTTTNTTTPAPATPSNGLVSLYTDSTIGEPINNILNRAQSLGIAGTCTDGLLITDCTFAVGDYRITTKNLLGTGIVTSILKNF